MVFSDGAFRGLCFNTTIPNNEVMTDYRYLISGKYSLVHYYARNLATKGYIFYTSFVIPTGKDPETIDAKLILKYETFLPRHTVSRNRRKGLASVKYVRCGNIGYLFATHGRSEFFTNEKPRCAFDTPFYLAGYAVSVNRETGKVTVSLHREYQRRLKRFIMTWGHRRPSAWWVNWFNKSYFFQYRGVRENLFSLIKVLNANRRDFKLEPIPWEEVLGKKLPASRALLEPSSKELLDLLQFMAR
jgi:hypothetical protein